MPAYARSGHGKGPPVWRRNYLPQLNPLPHTPPQVISVWELAAGQAGRAIEGLTAQEMSDVASAMGALRDWKRIIKLFGSEASLAREALPALNRRR